jgi:nucleotide-binding universal stress UspA family protein
MASHRSGAPAMNFKNILVQVDATPHSRTRMAVAADIARRYKSYLTGLYVMDPQRAEIALPIDVPFEGEDHFATSERAKRQEQAESSAFLEALSKNGIEGEWRVVRGNADDIVPHWGRYMDLTIVGQSDPRDLQDHSSVVSIRTLLESGRPVLVLPYAGQFDRVGTNIVIAWKDTREASRALNDALPLLSTAGTVTLLAINPRWDDRPFEEFDDPAAIIAHLGRHGVTAEFSRLEGADLSVTDLLLNRCSDLGADLLVTGGFGHSRLRERMLGGVTRSLFDHMTLPVFMSH